MNKDDIIALANKWIKSIPDLKRDLRIIDLELKKGCYNPEEIEKLNKKKEALKGRLNTIAVALEKLEDVDQRIICYRYINKLTYKVIGKSTGYGENTISRKVNIDIPLHVGRLIFGMEQEFWDEFERGMR
ncbi:MAG: hypothetical protein ABRQ25_08955 [Clostridiaceae bacterium]